MTRIFSKQDKNKMLKHQLREIEKQKEKKIISIEKNIKL